MEKEFCASNDHLEINFNFEDHLWKDGSEGLAKDLEVMADVLKHFQINHLKRSEKFILNISLCGIDEITTLNSEHRQKNKATDVLSFPLQENLRAGEFDAFHEEIELGDIIICSEVCASQADEFKLSFAEEFFHLFVHGYLHLCGFDHELSAVEEKMMEAHEEVILLEFKNKR